MSSPQKKNIVIAVETLSAGGAELFCLRLAKELALTHRVIIYCVNMSIIDFGQLTTYEGGYDVLAPSVFWHKIFTKIDRFLFKLKIDFSFAGRQASKVLEKIVIKNNTDCIHSHLFKTDYIVVNALKSIKKQRKLSVNHVTTIHGDYITFSKMHSNGIPIYNLLNYPDKLDYNIKNINTIVCIGEHQIKFFKELENQKNIKLNLTKIYNGYSKPAEIQATEKSGNFRFGMVSRGIPEKGWEVAIQAFIELDLPESELVLVGGSTYLEGLKTQYSSYKNILFTGQSDDPLSWIATFDIGLLPSTYPSESLPTVLIEYMLCNVPAIASNVGEIKNMLIDQNRQIGMVIDLKDGKVPLQSLKLNMKKLYGDNFLYQQMKNNTNDFFEKFNMDHCIREYEKVYAI